MFVPGLKSRQNESAFVHLAVPQHYRHFQLIFTVRLGRQRWHELFVAKCNQWIDACSATCWEVASQDSGSRQNQRDAAEDEGIVSADSKKEAGKYVHGCEGNQQAQCKTHSCQPHSLFHYKS